MRELFDEVSGKSPLDPEEAVRRTTRGPRRKRFYARAGVVDAADGFAITLDDRPVRTPSGRPLVAPTREIAEAMAAGWAAPNDNTEPPPKVPGRPGEARAPPTSPNISDPPWRSIAPAIPRRLGGEKPAFWIVWCMGRPR